MKRFFKIFLLVAILFTLFPAQNVQAIDPVTIAILAPIALRAAEAAKPYLIRAGLNTLKCFLKMGKDVWEILYLPYGMLKMAFLGPFSRSSLRSGLIYTIKGSIAPAKLVVHTLLLPLMMFGLNINI